LKNPYMFVNGNKKHFGGPTMGLWLKCPHCLTANALDLKSCAKCGASLEKLPAAKRVYIFDKKAPKPPEPAAAKKPAAHEAPLAPEAQAPEAKAPEAPPKKEAAGEAAPKRAKGSKSRKKKQ